MFYGCRGLEAAPELPAMTLAESCYEHMFYGCRGLEAAPELPATTLAESCYEHMFYGCTGLAAAPELPATELAESCYACMFEDCRGFTTAPELPATELAESCYEHMFDGCIGLAAAPELPATTLASNCYNSMFRGCIGLVAAPELPATTLAEGCYAYMFSCCTGIELYEKGNSEWRIPSEGAITETPSGWNEGMFNGTGGLVKQPEANVTYYKECSDFQEYLTFSSNESFTLETINHEKNWNGKLYYAIGSPEESESWSEWNGIDVLTAGEEAGEWDLYLAGTRNTVITGYSYWGKKWILTGNNIRCIGNIESLLDYAKVYNEMHPTMYYYCFAGLFSGCTGLVAAPELPATALEYYCYKLMFEGCTGLVAAPELPAPELAESCYAWMFSGCTGLVAAPELPATELAESCYEDMFYGCTSLTEAPELTATELENYCYNSMFRDCIGLVTAPELPATTLANSCYKYMFYGCTNLTEAPELPATTLAEECYKYMFYGCTSLTEVPELPATMLAEECYKYMFYGCRGIGLYEEGNIEWCIPSEGAITETPSGWNSGMFGSTGGTVTEPEINTTYYQRIDSTVTVQAGPGGQVSSSQITDVAYGTAISAGGNVLTVGTETVTAEASQGYYFKNWSGIPESGIVKHDLELQAVFAEIIESHPEDQSAREGETVTFSVRVHGDDIVYRWQYSRNGVTWADSTLPTAATAELKVKVDRNSDGLYCRCVVTDPEGYSVNSEAAKVTMTFGVTEQPEEQSAKENQIVTFSVKARGTVSRYQWQCSRNGVTWADSTLATATKADLKVKVNRNRDGLYYRCVVTDPEGYSVNSEAAKITMTFGVTEQPENQSAKENQIVTFSVRARGTVSRYQWQYSGDGETWTDSTLSTATKADLRVKVNKNRDGIYYRCVVTDPEGYSVNSKAAKITMTFGVTEQSGNQSAKENQILTFSVRARGTVSCYQWQYSRDGGDTWTDSTLATATKADLKVKVLGSRDGYYYRCVVTDPEGYSVNSKAAKITMTFGVTEQPGNRSAKENKTVTFSVKAKGTVSQYQWQCSRDGETWADSTLATATKADLKVKVNRIRDGIYYRCVITDSDGYSVNSKAAKVTMTFGVTEQSGNQSAKENQILTFSVRARGTVSCYQWQYSRDGGETWTDSTLATATKADLKVKVLGSRDGYYYRCVITDSDGYSVNSKKAKLTMTFGVAEQPEEQSAKENQIVTFSVKARGTVSQYQWQYSRDDGETWANSTLATATKADLKVKVNRIRDGVYYRCVITDSDGYSVNSKAAKVTMTFGVTEQPEDVSCAAGATAVFTVKAKGTVSRYQWQCSKDGGQTWIDSTLSTAATANLKVKKVKQSMDGYQYRCVITDSENYSVRSSAAVLHVSSSKK